MSRSLVAHHALPLLRSIEDNAELQSRIAARSNPTGPLRSIDSIETMASKDVTFQ